MKTLTSLSLIAAVSVLSLPVNAQTHSFAMEFTAKGHAYIRANLNQLENYPMVLDTAAQTGLLPQSILPSLKLDEKDLSTDDAVGATGAVRMQAATVRSTKVGPFEHKDLNYLVQDLKKLTLPDGKMPGILGHDFLHNYCVDLNFKETRVNLTKGACETSAVAGLQQASFKIENNFIRLQAQVQGATADVLLDTGAHHTFINTPLYKQLSGLSISGMEKTGGMTGHTQDRQVLSGLNYQLNGHTVNEERSYLADMHVFEVLGYKDKAFMLMGINAFKNGRLVMDYTNQTMYFRQ
jgi:predicted aspartyl protease